MPLLRRGTELQNMTGQVRQDAAGDLELSMRISGKLRFARATIGACRGAKPDCVTNNPPRVGDKGG
jgi:hypothetical protein